MENLYSFFIYIKNKISLKLRFLTKLVTFVIIKIVDEAHYD